MKIALKILVRIIGTVAGLFGLLFLIELAFMIRSKLEWLVILLSLAWFVPLGAYLLYVTYLVWRQFSPLAVQHVSFVLTLILFGSLIRYLLPTRQPPLELGSVLLHLGRFAISILGAYLFYRACCFGALRVLFPPEKG